MEFNFPDNKTIFFGTIQKFRTQHGRFIFADIDILDPKDNLIEINGISYFFTYLQGAIPGNKGGNSILLNLYDSQSIDTDNVEYGKPDLVLKISKFKRAANPAFAYSSEKRFLKEISALKACEEKQFQNIIKLFHNGVCRIKNFKTGNFDHHLFYTMEHAEFDLKNYMELNYNSLNLDEKLSLCISLCEGIKELYSLGYYHRDIKPDNIFMIDDAWKIGDLGLLSERNKINEIDKIAEAIGPKGWMSPESMNKYLCEGKGFQYNHNCNIDHQSDIFQLGKVFWYVFQQNVPIGSVKEKDFLIKNTRIYAVLKTMLSHSKKPRYKEIDEIIKLLKFIEVDQFKKLVA